ncbi:MAG TPA: hypothetical protein VHD87_05950 [Acidimicrobiales bacterium]|nr:hypothetical protein [Acidimicrobiales bacterium]
MDEAPETVETTVEPTPVVAAAADPVNRVLTWAAAAVALLGIAELVGTMGVGLAVNVKKMNFPTRQGYAFLTNLEKSPIGIALIVAAVFGALALARARAGDQTQLTTVALWVVVVSSLILGVGTILAVMARFRVAQLVATQPVDSLTRRVLVVFVIRNFGSAVVAALIAVGAIFRPAPAPVD